MHVGTISIATGILIHNENQTLFVIEEYLMKMNVNYTITQDMRINNKTLYRNIHATCHLINQSIMGITHMSSFYTPKLYIVDCIMSQDPNLCMCTQQLDMIIDAKMRSRPGWSLPYLITQLYHTFITDAEFDPYAPSRRITVSCHNRN